MKVIEKKLKGCKRCKPVKGFALDYGKTVHVRNGSSMGGFGILINLVLVIFTAGLWLGVLLPYLLLTAQIGGWKCEPCMERKTKL